MVSILSSSLDYGELGSMLGIGSQTAALLIALIIVWTLAWKGVALWKSSRKGSLIWFIILLVVNTLGLLEILYIFLFSKISLEPKKPVRQTIRTKRQVKKSSRKKK